jgi:alpha-methylacyl-CoA racemase
VCGVLDARTTGRGQVVDAAMVDGVAQLATLFFSFAAAGSWGPPGTNMLDSGAHFYEVYETADGRYMAVGAMEPQFYAELLRLLGIPSDEAPQWERERWPELKQRFASVFRSRTREAWTEVFELADACTTPVLSFEEATMHPHNVARGTFVEKDGALLPTAAPRFGASSDSHVPEVDAEALATAWGLKEAEIAALNPS